MTVTCPICHRKVKQDEPDFPFCSERCRLVDLGNWATGKYTIPGNPAQTFSEDDEE